MAKRRILLVDDEADFLALMGSRIERWGYDLITASGGREAVEAVESKNPDAIVLDFLMPEMDGAETLRKIRKINKRIPVIMFTAHPDIKVIAGTEKLGVSAFIPKLSMYQDAHSTLRTALNILEKNQNL
jgi:DNA-binding NtrC family response regulator